jgi:cytochrome c-type protein NapC
MGLTAILYAQITLTIVLALVFLIRPSVTAGTSGKIIAFIGLCVLPALCIVAGMNTHMQRSETTTFCISCHAMEGYGRSLYIDDPSFIPAAHFQNHRVPADMACFSCHADYGIYGPLKDKMRGLTRIYKQYVTSPPNPITIPGGFKNDQCLHCHAGARSFEESPTHSAMMDTLKSGQLSCVSSGCHDHIHPVNDLKNLKFWSPGQ